MRQLILGTALVFSITASPAWAGLTLSTDSRSLFFGRMSPGEEQDLAQFGSFQNEITVSSTNQKTWHLKISLLNPLASGAHTIPPDRLFWQVTRTSGSGTLAHQHQFVPFSLSPELVYLSGPGEASGTNVTFEIKYRLRIPTTQISGVYQTTLRFTLTEVL